MQDTLTKVRGQGRRLELVVGPDVGSRFRREARSRNFLRPPPHNPDCTAGYRSLSHCKKSHVGEGGKLAGVCYRCIHVGHLIRDCLEIRKNALEEVVQQPRTNACVHVMIDMDI